jgi:hypothetical protein
MRIINLRVEQQNLTTCARIDRGSNWGNPFIMRNESERSLVIAKFQAYANWRLTIEPGWLEPLRGMDLACWCSPKACHGEVIVELLRK